MHAAAKIRHSVALILSLVFAAACGGDSPAAPQGDGTVVGVVTAADGVTPVALAQVYIEAQGVGSATTSAADGSYRLESVPSGNQVVVALKGAFRSEKPVAVVSGETVTAPASALAPSGKLGYVAGSFDMIEEIVRDLGYPIEEIAVDRLSDASLLSQYRVIFLNCGAGVDPADAPALKEWLNNGGILYASDWELDVIREMFPNDIQEVGSGDAQVITATITDQSLRTFTGKTTAEIAYDLGSWQMLVGVSATPTVLLRGTVIGFDQETFEERTYQNQPLAITMTHGKGRMVYTTFHNEAGVTEDQLAVLRYFIHL